MLFNLFRVGLTVYLALVEVFLVEIQVGVDLVVELVEYFLVEPVEYFLVGLGGDK
jgi:hypothetical protein